MGFFSRSGEIALDVAPGIGRGHIKGRLGSNALGKIA